MAETDKEFVKCYRATCEVAYRDCKLEEKQIQTVLNNTGLLGIKVRLWEGVSAAKDGLEACTRLEAANEKIEQQQKQIESMAGQLDQSTEHLEEKQERIEQLEAENKQLKADYALLEECSPPDWPRKKFVKYLFELWEKQNDMDCKWVYDEEYDMWETECDNAFSLYAGTPKDNKMKYCPYCGKKIEQALKGK